MKKVFLSFLFSCFILSVFAQTNSYTRADTIHLTNTPKNTTVLIDGKLRVLRATAGSGTDSVYSKGADGFVHLIKVTASGSFINNSTSLQTGANFNISGIGAAVSGFRSVSGDAIIGDSTNTAKKYFRSWVKVGGNSITTGTGVTSLFGGGWEAVAIDNIHGNQGILLGMNLHYPVYTANGGTNFHRVNVFDTYFGLLADTSAYKLSLDTTLIPSKSFLAGKYAPLRDPNFVGSVNLNGAPLSTNKEIVLTSHDQNIAVIDSINNNLHTNMVYNGFEVHNSAGGLGGTDEFSKLTLNSILFTNENNGHSSQIVTTTSTQSGDLSYELPAHSGTLATLSDITGGTGTVTNVATGFGLTGGPITTTGTLKSDSTAVRTVNNSLSLSQLQTKLNGYLTPTGTQPVSNKTFLPANIHQTPLGTVATDSIAVKLGSTGKLGAIATSGIQKTLTAGTNITIAGTTISATGGGASSVTNTGTYENATISGTTLNVPNMFPRVWDKLGSVTYGDLTADQGTTEESTVIFEGSPQILTNASGSVFKMWFTGGYASPNIYYQESLDGITWVRQTTAVVTGHARSCVLKVSSTYYMFASLGTAGAQIDRYTSSNGVTWTLTNSAVIPKGTGSTWNSGSVSNSSVINDGGTFKALVEATASTGGSNNMMGYYSSTDLGVTWTASGSNPVISTVGGKGAGNPYLTKIGSTFYVWYGGSPSINVPLPTDIYRASSPDMVTWTQAPSGTPVLSRTMADEGVGTTGSTTGGQVADPTLVEANGKTYMYYSANSNGGVSTGNTHIKLAIANYTLANLVATNEGDGAKLNLSIPDVYDKTASDLRYLQGGTTYQNNTPTTVYIQSQFDGFRVQDPTATGTIGSLLNNELFFNKTGGVTNSLQAGSGGWIFQATGATGFTFQNSTNGNIATIDNVGNFSLKGITATGTYSSTAAVDLTLNSLAATTTFGLALRNNTNATSGVARQFSPAIYRVARVWNTTSSASNFFQMYDDLEPVSGATPSVLYTIKLDNNGGGFNTVSTLDNLGKLSISNLNLSGLTASMGVATDASKNLISVNTPATQATADLTAQTSAGNVTTFTVGASTATFNISGYINITAVTVDVIEMQLTYTDENSTSQTANFFTQGATSALLSAIGNSVYPPMTIRAKNGTVITVKTTLTTGTGSITFDAGSRITQL